MPNRKRSIEEKKALVADVLNLVEAEDIGVEDACQRVGVPVATYYFIKKQLRGKVARHRTSNGFKPNVAWSPSDRVRPTMTVAFGSGKEMASLFREILRSI